MKIVIAGSFAEADKILRLREVLMIQKHDVFPTPEHVEESRIPIEAHHKGKGETINSLSIRANLMRRYFQKIKECDILFVMNEKNGKEYIGLGTAFEIGYAYALNKKVVFYHKPTDGNTLSMRYLLIEPAIQLSLDSIGHEVE